MTAVAQRERKKAGAFAMRLLGCVGVCIVDVSMGEPFSGGIRERSSPV
jgi:hypothetical protein